MEWKISPKPINYEKAVTVMEERVRQIRAGTADEMVWLLEHPALYTAGSSAHEEDLIDTLGLPVYKTGRGGQYTYHGPGQRVAYIMLDLKKRIPDVRAYVQQLENWIITTLADFDIESFTREGRVGVWVNTEGTKILSKILQDKPVEAFKRRDENVFSSTNRESKIAAIGVRLHQWVTYHGIAININPNLNHYQGIVPCGISDYGVTSMHALGINIEMKEIDKVLQKKFKTIF